MIKKFTTLCLLAFALFMNEVTMAQTSFQWAKGWGDGYDDYTVGVATDASGNVYTLGVFYGTIDLDPGPATFTIATKGANDIFITKLDPAGNLLWAKRLGGGGNDDATDITVDAAGNVYTTGYFIYTADFDPGTGVSNLTAVNNDVFISKLDANGNFVWARNLGGGGSETGMGIHVDASGNVYTTGTFGYAADFDPSPTTTYTLAAPSSNTIFISKLDINGNFVWAKAIGGAGGANLGEDITTDAAGNVYTTGQYTKADFDPDATATFSMTCVTGYNSDIFVSKLDPNGNFVWAVSMGDYNFDYGRSIACNAAGEVYVAGDFSNIVDFDPSATGTYTINGGSSSDAFVLKLTQAGDLIWVKNIGGILSKAIAMGLKLDANENVYTTGSFYGTTDFDPNAGTVNFVSSGSSYNDVFVSMLDANGNYNGAAVFGSSGANDYGTSIDVDGSGNIIVGGNFNDTCDFDPAVSTYTLLATSPNWSDAFVMKMGSIATGIQNKAIQNAVVSAYPNPFSNNITFKLTGTDMKQFDIVLYDVLGKEVKREEKITEQTATMDVSELNAGIYFYKLIQNGKAITTGKLIAE
ncbi:MAG: T9SS type A sorting domain-containing protein [Bacteroidota bacterium]